MKDLATEYNIPLNNVRLGDFYAGGRNGVIKDTAPNAAISKNNVRMRHYYAASKNTITYTSYTFPPGALTSNTETLLGRQYGNGGYTSAASSINSSTHDAYNAFDNDNATYWASANTYDSSGSYIGSITTTSSSVAYTGEFCQICIPYAIVPATYTIIPAITDFPSSAPKTWIFTGSNNGTTWTTLDNQNIPYAFSNGAGVAHTITIPVTTLTYRYFRLIVQTNNGTVFYTSLGGLQITGNSAILKSGLIGYFTGDSWIGTQWTDMSGAGNHVNGSNVGGTIINSGTLNSLAYLAASTKASRLTFPSTILPSQSYTLIHLSRKPNGENSRIFGSRDSAPQPWLSGFNATGSGIAFHGKWITSTDSGHGTNWVLSSDQYAMYRSNKVNRTISTPSPHALSPVGYNTYELEQGIWNSACVVFYNRVLTITEIQEIENELATLYNLGF